MTQNFIFCWPCLSLQILANNQLDGLFHVFIFIIPDDVLYSSISWWWALWSSKHV